ncbi:hypothetical protein DL96DRAFT_1813924 [Flagelloscypha sp. PMI_526]|nr:hypothetical protein DL96DRAFT_1813924 [Flagelloscypha sp. PMI_526]
MALFIPPEIWMKISSYLSFREVKRLTTLCRTFAMLSEQRLFLSTGPAYWWEDQNIPHSASAVDVITKRLSQRINVGTASSMKSLCFYSMVQDEAYPSSNSLWKFTTRSIVLQVQRALSFPTGRLPDIYGHFTSLDRLAFLIGPAKDSSYPDCYRDLHIHTLWNIVSSNLRELSISVVNLHTLSGILPGPGTLPRLEIMRFSCDGGKPPFFGDSSRPLSFLGQLTTRLHQLSALYANQNLRELDLYIMYKNTYFATAAPGFAETLLPSCHTFPKLERFTFRQVGVMDLDMAFYESECSIIASFIRGHASTLRQITTDSGRVVHDLRMNPPTFSTLPAFSFDSWDYMESSKPSQPSETIFTSGLAALYYHGGRTRHSDYGPPSQTRFSNLRRLVYHEVTASLGRVAALAQALPLLVSLEATYAIKFSFPPEYDSDQEPRKLFFPLLL